MKKTNKLNNEGNTATPYDDVHQTMLNDCPRLIIPVVNEMFHKQHSENEKITVLNNEFFVNRQNGTQTERITDTHFLMGSVRYHLECQSSIDGTIMYRIFEKKLFFLIPFHIFVYESDFNEYDTDEEKLNELTKVYEEIVQKLDAYAEKKAIDEYTRLMIIDMSKKALEHLANKYSNVKEGVGIIMGGKILDYPAKDILNRGRAEGARNRLVSIVQKKLANGQAVEKIAEDLLEEQAVIEQIVEELQQSE